MGNEVGAAAPAVRGPGAAPAGQGTAGWSALLAGRNGIYALALAGGVTLHAVNIYIATTVMPSVVDDIGGLEFYAWATTLFVVASILGAALTARLLAIAGPRGAYLSATLIFATGTLTCSLAPGMPTMLAGRAIQGLGGGFLYALAYGLTRVVLPAQLWGRAIGIISAMFGVATLVGPAVGGMFAEHGAWRAAFLSLLPFAAVFALVAWTMLPGKGRGTNERTPVPLLQLLLLAGAVLAVSAGSLSADLSWNLAGLVAAAGMVALIAARDAGAGARLLPRRSFSLATPLGALYLAIALLMISMQPEVFVPYMLRVLHGQSPLWAGYLAALMAIGWTAGSFLGARGKGEGRLLLLASPVVVFAGLVLLALFLPLPGGGQAAVLVPVCLGLALVGLGIGLAWTCLVTRVYRSAPAGEQDLAAGGMTTVQLFAMAFGTALAGMVANLAGIADPGGAAGASSAALWLGGIFALAPVLCLASIARVLRLTR